MSRSIDAEQVRRWIDDDLVDSVERIPDERAEFNFGIELSNILVHVVRRQPDGPLVLGQQIEYDDGIRSRFRELSDADRNDLVARLREVLTTSSVVYGFHDERGANVRFEDVHRIFVEHRIYADALGQHVLMSALIDIWKVVRYLDDLPTLIGSVEN
jgi:hypothetical protein